MQRLGRKRFSCVHVIKAGLTFFAFVVEATADWIIYNPASAALTSMQEVYG